MLDLSKDAKCKTIEDKLSLYIDLSCEVDNLRKHIKNDDDFAKNVRRFDEANAVRDDFFDSLDRYVAGFANVEDKKQIAGRFLFKILNFYKEKQGDKKYSFANESVYLASKIIEKYPLSDEDKRKYRVYIIKNRKKNKLTPKALNILYADVEKDNKVKHENPLDGKDISTVTPSADLIKKYTAYLCDYASDKNDENVSVMGIHILLRRNAEFKGLCDVNATLFDEGYKKEAIDKNLVSDVAKIYAQNIDKISVACGENNQYFDNNMCKMLGHVVSSYGYTPKEVEALKQTLVDNSQDTEFAKRMAQNIGVAYIASKQNKRNLSK